MRKIASWPGIILLQAVLVVGATGGCSTPDGKSNATPATSQDAATATGAEIQSTSVFLTDTTPSPSLSTRAETPVPTEDRLPFEPLAISAPGCDYGGTFKSIESVDRYTVRFILCRPEPAFLSKIAFPTFGIQPLEWIERTGGGGANSLLLEKPIGTGPYIMADWKRGDGLVFQAFDQYWDETLPKTNHLIFRWERNAVQRMLELQTGMVDGVDNVSPADFSTIQVDPNLRLAPRPALNTFYIGMNNTYPPFDDGRVRQALAYAIDRQRIVTELFPDGYETADYFTPCSIPNGCVGDLWYEYKPDVAKQLIDEAGYPNGFKVELTYRDVVRGYLPRPGVVAQEIRAQLKKNLGIDVDIKVLEENAFLEAVDAGELPGLHLLGWGSDYPDVTNFLDVHFGLDASEQFGDKYEDITTALTQGAAIYGDLARHPYYEKANNAIRKHVPVIPISHGGWATSETLAVAYTSVVRGAHTSPLGQESFAAMAPDNQDTFVWLQSAEPISLYCADETDIESLRVCAQVVETLYRYQVGGVAVEPGLAEICQPDDDLTTWTCTLREGVVFHDGSSLDANDVVMTFWVQWDAAHPLHTGHSGSFYYFQNFFGNFLAAESKPE